MNSQKIGIIGASSMVGWYAVESLRCSDSVIVAFTRSSKKQIGVPGVTWRLLMPQEQHLVAETQTIPYWLCLCPIWKVSEHFALLKELGAKRVVALSSTSRFTKVAMDGAVNAYESELVQKLAEGEQQLQVWGADNGIEWVILRPTLIYDLKRDKNISHIFAFIRRYGFFPIFRGACGLRQPVHASEVADVAGAALWSSVAANKSYNISGGETLTYREMVVRIFHLLGRKPRFVNVPIWGFQIAVRIANLIPRYRYLSSAMARRMAADLVFDHSKARVDLGFSPGKFCDSPHVKAYKNESRSKVDL